MPTIETTLGGRIPSVYLDHGPSIPLRFILQLRHKLTPSNIADRFAELGILDHVLHRKTLDTDRLIFTNQFRRKPVLEITASISDTGMDTSYFQTGCRVVLV